MGAKKNPRVEDRASDQEDPETQLSEVEEEEELAAPETDNLVPVEELTNEDILRGAWQGSLVTEEHIDRLRRRRQIPNEVETRVPPHGECQPNPKEGEYVVFYSHFDRGFALPLNTYARSVMEFFKLQPHHLPANAILVMSCVAACMEAYVGIGATKDIFAK